MTFHDISDDKFCPVNKVLCFVIICHKFSEIVVEEVLHPHPSKPHPRNMPQAKTEVALQFSESCAAKVGLQHSLFCIAEVNFTKSCAAASENLQCNIEKAACRKVALSAAFLRISTSHV